MIQLFKKIPVTISPLFWVVAAMIGFLNTNHIIGMLIWIPIIFISILFHEYGHALTSLFFGQHPKIALVAFGGVTYPQGPRLHLGKEFFVVLNGPLFGLALFVLGRVIIDSMIFSSPIILYALHIFMQVNLYWTLLNLLPVLPLDGGQLLRILLEFVFGAKGLTLNFLISVCLAGILGFICFFMNLWLPGALFLLFAFQNFESWKQMRNLTDSDRSEPMQQQLRLAEQSLQQGDTTKAKELLHSIRASHSKGILHQIATESLARIYFQEHDLLQSYELFKSVKGGLDPESKEMLHEAAFATGDWELVNDLSQECFQYTPSQDIALRASISSAQLHHVDASLGWLETALQKGLNLREAVKERGFDPIRNVDKFQQFLERKGM